MADGGTGARSGGGTSYLSSVLALVVGILLAVAVSALFGAFGWGGELASQTAGAASGAAPLIIDGVRQRASRTPRQEVELARRGAPSLTHLLVATLFAFAVLLTDNLLALLMSGLARASVWLSKAPDSGWQSVYVLLEGVFAVPLLLLCTYAYGIAAGHRLGAHRKRWILLGIVIFTVVRVVTIAASRFEVPDAGTAALVAGAAVTAVLLLLAGLLGARRAAKTQSAFRALTLFRRLPPQDQAAVLALIGDAAEDDLAEQEARSAVGRPSP